MVALPNPSFEAEAHWWRPWVVALSPKGRSQICAIFGQKQPFFAQNSPRTRTKRPNERKRKGKRFSMRQNAAPGSIRPKSTCLSIPSGLGTTLEKIFFSPRPWWTPHWPQIVRVPGCPPAAPSDHTYGGLGGPLRDSEAWKPQNVGGCGSTRCPRSSDLSPVAQDTARAGFRGAGAHCADFGAFWRLFGPFLGHIVELKGNRGLLDTAKSSRTWSVATVSLCLTDSPGFGRYFGRKMAAFWPKTAQIWEGTPQLGTSAPGPYR